ncbi:VOC family protein [Neobacillus sp. YIM B06451]|uniref:VOC family protein n=1 Tax=Neobacillus sp. YIM B06451 TaxID=3070994 RepID=UPI00292CAEE1|nr:VOC family protein [Neobacillus sp. YIM B06451]
MIAQEGHCIFILYVSDQERAKSFYESLFGIEPILDVPGMTEFVLTPKVILGIMPEKGIVKILEGKIPNPETASGVPRSEIYLYVDSPDDYYTKLIQAGGRGISRAFVRSWGDTVSYGMDLDGHILAFAKKHE